MTKTVLDPADYIAPLNMNGMQGRMLRMPAPKSYKREILFIYGHHSSLERWFGFSQVLNRYGAVTMPDLPGFREDALQKPACHPGWNVVRVRGIDANVTTLPRPCEQS